MQVKTLTEENDIVRILVNDNVITFYDVKVSGKVFNGKRFVDLDKTLIGFSVFNLSEEGTVDGLIENMSDDEISVDLI